MSRHKYATGTSFFQPTTEVHNFRNEGSEPLVVYALYYLPAGTPEHRNSNRPAAACELPNNPVGRSGLASPGPRGHLARGPGQSIRRGLR